MLRKSLTAGVTALAIAAGAFAFSAPASAASLSITFGPNVTTWGMYHGHRHQRVCHTKYEWRHHHKVAVGTVCHWR